MANKNENQAALTSELKEVAIKVGAEKVGIAPIERFAPAPLGFKPTDSLPGTESVVAFLVPQLDGYLEAAPSIAYQHYGYIFKNLFIDRIAWEIARFLDDHGYIALPYCREGQTTVQAEGMNPNPFFERDFKPTDDPAPPKLTMRGDVSMRRAAEAAGLGRIGTNSLLLTPWYGPRHRIGLVFTTAKLDATPVIDAEICRKCFACVRACPGEAITEAGHVEFDPTKCSLKVMGRFGESLEQALKTSTQRSQNVWDEETRLRGDANFTKYHNFVSTGRCGSPCMSICPTGERNDKFAEGGWTHTLTSTDVKERANDLGVDFIGIASADRFDNESDGFKPGDILPDAKSVVTVGVEQLRAYMEKAPDATFLTYGFREKNEQLTFILWKLALMIEKDGYKALPIVSYGEGELFIDTSALPGRTERRMKARAEMRGSFSNTNAAVQAGLGEIGLSGMFLHPEYGPRVHIGSIITTAPLDADPLFTGKLCDRENCRECLKQCPAHAIGEDGRLSDVDCLIALNDLTTSYEDTIRKMLEEQGKESLQKRAAWAVGYTNFGGTGFCGIPCLNACPVGKKELI